MTADPELEASIQRLAEKVKIRPLIRPSTRFAQMLKEIVTPPDRREPEEPKPPVNPNFKPVLRLTSTPLSGSFTSGGARSEPQGT